MFQEGEIKKSSSFFKIYIVQFYEKFSIDVA